MNKPAVYKIAIQGDRASFHDIAATKLFGKDSERVFCNSFLEAFRCLESDQSNYALCAIENSLFGSINEVYDLLVKHHHYITGEVYLRIEQCLIGLPNSAIDRALKVYSHPVALAQCDQYMDNKLRHADREECHDTAAAVALVKELGDPSVVAIGSRQAAKLHGLKILAGSIETNKENYTRFVVLRKTMNTSSSQNKTSLILQVNHVPGALYAVLGVFAKNNVNLTKLQSRPIPGKAWQYMFYVDIEVGACTPLYSRVLTDLHALKCAVILLGSYEAADNMLN